MVALAELLFFAYRDFTGDADAVLAEMGFGRAHHRVLHFVTRRPGLRVAELLQILKITKQSLARVLRQLVDQGYIVQKRGEADGRERLLYVTETGSALVRRLSLAQSARMEAALKAAGPSGEEAVLRFLKRMVSADDKNRFTSVLALVRSGESHGSKMA
jgi:DNA-binding MarR family transcriptional regulator